MERGHKPLESLGYNSSGGMISHNLRLKKWELISNFNLLHMTT
jgi:hypothetical protein